MLGPSRPTDHSTDASVDSSAYRIAYVVCGADDPD